MMLREDLRNYVKQINDQSVATGVPMMRPMFFQFPDDPVCAGNQAEKQFMCVGACVSARFCRPLPTKPTPPKDGVVGFTGC